MGASKQGTKVKYRKLEDTVPLGIKTQNENKRQ
jgi:hypothetical protein